MGIDLYIIKGTNDIKNFKFVDNPIKECRNVFKTVMRFFFNNDGRDGKTQVFKLRKKVIKIFIIFDVYFGMLGIDWF